MSWVPLRSRPLHPRTLLAAAACSFVLAGPFPAGASNLKSGTFAPAENAAKIPAFFVPNAGQTRPDVRFQAAIAGRTVLFTSRQVIWMTPRAPAPAESSTPASGTRLDVSRQARPRGISVGALSFEGARPEPAVSGIDPIAAKISFLRGSDPARWRAQLPAYRGLLYRELYPGIDLRLDLGGTGYDDGYTILAEADGKLAVIGTTSSDALATTPDAVQRTFGGVYDAHFARIDAALSGQAALFYAKYLGGSNDDEGFGLAFDALGVAHVSGFTVSSDFPQRTCALQPGSGGGYDAFFAMIRPSIPGTAGLAFASFLGGAGTDAAFGAALDGAGDVFLAGQTSSGDFPTANPADDTLGGATDAFVTAFAILLPAPASVNPRSGPAAGGTVVTITGAHFQAGATLAIGGADAGNVAVGGETQITASTPAQTPGTLNDIVVGNPDDCGGTLPRAWMADFLDVPPSQLFHNAVEKIFRARITLGCSGGNYCPEAAVTRDQMAIFLLRGKHGSSFTPPPATGTAFGDMAANAFGAAWIERLLFGQITTGCGGGNYCPAAVVNRASMAVMLLRAKHGGSYQPLPAVGLFDDVPTSDPFARWIEQLAHEGITGGCGGDDFCPNKTTTRGEMAAFLARTFALP